MSSSDSLYMHTGSGRFETCFWQFRQAKHRGCRQKFIDTLDVHIIEFDIHRHRIAESLLQRQGCVAACLGSHRHSKRAAAAVRGLN
ncbi:hypothetical protein, partial [Faecalibaculum rodentium]|uniref:hypothetical protein n=1 Tax=Faecalibaculum rodentium TaxID=1702221 RepID=UPI0026055C94